MTPTIGVSHADARKKILEALKSENWNVTSLNEYNAIQKRASFMALTFVALIIIYSLSFESNNEGNRAMRPGLMFCLVVYAVSALISLASYFLRSRTLNKEMSHTVHHLIHHFETSVHQHENSDNQTNTMPPSSGLPHDTERLVKLMSGHSHLSIINVFRDSTWQKLPAVLLVEGDLVALMGGDVTPCKVQQLKDELVVIPPSKKPESRWNLGSILEAGDLIPVDIININPEANEEMSEGLSSKVGSVRYPSSVAGSERGGSNAAATSASTNTAQQLRNRVITPESLEILKFSGNMRCFMVLENPVVQVIRLLLTRAQERKEKTFFTNVRHQTEEIMAYVAIGSVLVCGCIVVLKRIFGFIYFANILLTVLVPLISLLVIFAPPNLWLLENMIETFGTAAVLASRWVLMSAPNAKKKTTDFDVDEEFDDHPMPSDRKRSDSKPTNTNGDGSLHPEVAHLHTTAATTGEQEAWSKTPFHFTPKTDQDGWLKATFRSNPVRLIGHSHSILAYVTKVLQRRWRITFDTTTADAPIITSTTTTTTNTTSCQDDQFTLPFESSNFSEELGSISMVCFIDDDIICENNAVCEEVLLMGEENNELSTATTPTPKRSTTEALAKSIREHNTTNHAKCLVMDLHSGTVENGKRFENPLWWQQLPSLKPLGLACLMNHAGSTMDMSSATLSSSSSSMMPTMSPVSSSESFAVTAAAATNSMGEASLVDASATTTGKFTHKSSAAPMPFTSSLLSTPSPSPPPPTPSVTQIKHHLVHHVRRNLPMPFLKDLSEEIGFQATDAANFTKLFEINVLSPKLDQEYLSQESHQMSLEESKRRGFLMPKLRSTLCKDTRGGFQMIGVGDPALVLSYCKEYWDGNTRTITPLSPADREEILQFYERWRLEDFEVVAFAYTPVPDSPHLESFIRHSQVDPATAIARPPMATLSAASLAAMATANATATATAANTTTTATGGGGGGSNGNLASGSGSGHHHHMHHHMHHHHSHGGGNGDASSFIGPKPLYFVDLTTCVDGKATTTTTTTANGFVGETTSDATGHGAPGTMQSAAEMTATLSATSSGVTLQPFQSGYSHHTHDDSGHEDSSPERDEGNGRDAMLRGPGQPLDTVVEEGGYEHESGRGDGSGSGRVGGAGGAGGEDAQQGQPHQGHLESPTLKQRRHSGGKGSMPEPAGSGWKSTGSKSPSTDSNSRNHHSNSNSTNSYINNNNANNAAGAKQPMRTSPDEEEEDEGDEADGRKDEFDGEEGPDDLNTAAVMNDPGDEDGDEGDGEGDGDGDGDGDDACDGLTPECDGDDIDASASSKRQRHQSGRERFGTISDGENEGDGDGDRDGDGEEGGGRGRLGSTTGAVQGEGDTAGGRGSGDDEEDDNDWMVAYEQMAITRATTEPTGVRQTLRALEKAHGKYDEDDDDNEEGTGHGQDDGQGRPRGGGQRRSHRRRTSSASSTASATKAKSSPSRTNGRPRSSTDDIDEEAMGGDDGDGDGDGEEETTTSTVGFRRVATEPPMHLHGTHHGSSHREVNVGGRLPLPKALSVSKALDVMDQPQQQQQQQLMLQSRRRSSTTAGDSSNFPASPSPLLMTMKSSSEKHGRGLTKSTSIDGFTSSLMPGDALHDDERMAGEEDEDDDDDVNDDEDHHHRTGDGAASFAMDRTHATSGSPIEGHGSISGATATGSRMRSSSSKVRTSTGTSSSRRSGKTQGQSNATSKGGEAAAVNGSSSGIDFHRHASDQLMLFKKSNNKRELKAVNRLHARGLNALSELHLRQVKRLTYRSLWNITRQQIFLGMVASSVPVREDVPVLKEALDAAGVRFIYFSPRNMKRSKPIAEKIGIPFDWNCAISLRDLGDANVIDPHRHISSYADWDVLARMPHGIEAIKRHIREVDNVPLLVSLFTDSTPTTIRQMLEIFREYGETVLAIGSGYRCYHSDIFHSANIASSIATLPGVVPSIASKEQTLFDRFPKYDRYALSQMDIELAFRLVGLGTFNLIQCEEINGANKTADLSKLVQLIRVGRQILENQFQIFGFVVTVMVALALTVLLLHFVPLSTAPFLPIPMLMVYLLIYVPLLAWALLFVRNANDLLKNTPRKRLFVLKKADRDRFAWYLGLRASAVAVSAYVAGLLTTASVFRSAIYHRNVWGQQHAVSMMRSLSAYHTIFAAAGSDRSMWLRDLKSYWFIQDVVMNTVLMSLLVQCWTMQTRGYSVLAKKTTKWDGKWLLLLTMGVIVLVQVGIMTYRALLRSCFHDVDTTAVWFLSGMDCDVPQGAGSDYAAYDELHWSCWLAMFIVAPLLNLIVAEYVNAQDLKLRTRHLQFLRLEFDTRLGMHSPR